MKKIALPRTTESHTCLPAWQVRKCVVRGLLILTLILAIPVTASAEGSALEILEKSPRHHEWVAIRQGDREVHTFLVFPEVRHAALPVIIIHENRGLTDWVRSLADRVAEAGYIAVAPDLLSGMGPDGGRTKDFTDSDSAREAIYRLPQQQVTADLNAVVEYVKEISSANKKVAVAGFCWGGQQTFHFASSRTDLAASFVFYGTGPDTAEAVERIAAPVYGFYGGDDARVNTTLPVTGELMKGAGKIFEPVTYEGAGHAFMRVGEAADASAANKKARDEAWERWLDLLSEI